MLNDSSSFLKCSYNPETEISFLLLFMFVGVVVGLPGNLLALWIFCFRMKIWKPHTIFLFNLMIADFLLLFCLLFLIDAILKGGHWIYGEIFCGINMFVLAANRSASIGFMTIVALNRAFTVLHPMNCISRMSPHHAVWLSLFMWVIVIGPKWQLLTVDLMHKEGNRSMCFEFQNDQVAINVNYIFYIAEFILPWILLIFCSVRVIWYLKRQEQAMKHKKFKMAMWSIAVINLVFNVCFLPAFITALVDLVLQKFGLKDCEASRRMAFTFTVCTGLNYLNSALDPVIYTFSSMMFRNAIKDIFKRLGQIRKTNLHSTEMVDSGTTSPLCTTPS